MWLILQVACGLLVWPLLAEPVASLPSDSIYKDWYLEENPPTNEVHTKPKRPPKEQLFLHRPAKLQLKGSREPCLARLLQGPNKGSIKVPRRRTEASVLRQRSNLKPFGKVTHHTHRGSAKVNTSMAPPDGILSLGLHPRTKPLSGLLALSTKQRHRLLTKYLLKGYELDNRADTTGYELPPKSAQPMALYANTVGFDITVGRILAPMLFAVVMLALIFVFCFAESEDAAADESRSDNHKLYHPNSLDDTAELGLRTANTKANLLKLENSPGTWARTYRLGDKGSREALELLFRCNIIPVHEFADSFVSQEHIDECVWISTQMLREKSLDEWVEVWPLGMKTFEESVTACFAARTDVISNLYGQSPPNSPQTPRSDRGFMDCRIKTPATSQPRDCQSSSSTTEEHNACSATVLRNVLARHASTRADAPVVEADRKDVSTRRHVAVWPPHSTASQADSRSSVVTRCREIMSTIPTRASKKDQDDSDSSADPPLERGRRKSENASTSPAVSRSSTPPSMHGRFFPLPSIPASVSTLGRIDSYPPSERALQTSPDVSVTAPVGGSPALAGSTSKYAPRTMFVEGTMPKSTASPSSFAGSAGTTPQPKEHTDIPISWLSENSARLGGLPGTAPQPKEPAASPRGLPGTTPQPKLRSPRQIPDTPPSLSPRDAMRQHTPLFGNSRQTLARASSSEDPFASLRHDQTRLPGH